MNWLSILGSGPVVAIIGHMVTAGVTAAVATAVAKGYLPADSLSTIGGLVVIAGNAAASAARSTTAAAAKKVVAAGVVPVPTAASDPTVWGKKV